MKISKGAIITIIFALAIISVIVCAIIDGDSNPYPNTIKYLEDAFNKNEYGVKIIDSNKGEDITDSFISENKELYEKCGFRISENQDYKNFVTIYTNGDWDTIMENFNQKHCHLSVERNSDEE